METSKGNDYIMYEAREGGGREREREREREICNICSGSHRCHSQSAVMAEIINERELNHP